MGKIQELDPSLINKIAAGEVGELMNFQEWESKFLNEVDSNYELNKGKKAQPKPATRK